jgi:hypothetical protein
MDTPHAFALDCRTLREIGKDHSELASETKTAIQVLRKGVAGHF